MKAQDIETLVRRLEAGSILQCEFDDVDGSRLRLRFEAGGPAAHAAMPVPGHPAQVSQVSAPAVTRQQGSTLTAPRFGLFLHRHPDSGVGQAEPGRAVKAGDTVGFIQAGDWLVPVQATQAGVVGDILVAESALVGYGQPLVSLGASVEAN